MQNRSNSILKIVRVASTSVAALFLAFAVGGLFILLIGRNPIEVYGIFFSQTLGTPYGIGQVLFKATPLMFTGLSAALAFRSGLFNIGAEGQLTIGAFCTGAAGYLFAGLPAIILLPICILAGFLGGGIWGAIPGWLKSRFGAHEVINTIMMNFIAAGLVSYLVGNILYVPATMHTPDIGEGAAIPRMGEFISYFRGSPLNLSLFLAIATCVWMFCFLQFTRTGYEIRVRGANVFAAEYGKINVHTRTILAMTLAGGCAGLVGTNFVLGYKHYFELGFSEGIGFIGIAVALLARNHPIAIIPIAFLFGMLDYGGLAINTMIPKELVNILQSVVILFMIVLAEVFERQSQNSPALQALSEQNA